MEKESEVMEVACTHNNGRSPLAEAFMRKYLEKNGVQDYKAISSGTHVAFIDGMLAGDIQAPAETAKMILEMGVKRDFVHNKAAIENILRSENFHDDDAQRYILQIANRFVAEETAYKEQAFKQFNLGDPKRGRDQTNITPESRIVLGMGKENAEKIREIYKEYPNAPIIETLAGYASGNPDQEFESGFGGSLKDYLVMAETIKGHVHGAADRFLADR